MPRQNLVYTNRPELNAIAERAGNGEEPWSSALNAVMSDADGLLDAGFRSVTDDDGDHYFRKRTSTRYDYEAAQHMGDIALNCAFAYFFSGDDAYARKAIDAIHHYCVDASTYQEPTTTDPYEIDQCITVNAFWYAGAFLEGHPHWQNKSGDYGWKSGSGADGEEAFKEWTRDWASNVSNLGNRNNIRVWWLQAEMAAQAYLQNPSDVQALADKYKSEQHGWGGFTGEYFTNEISRDDGMFYNGWRLFAHFCACEVARNATLTLDGYNDDLYPYNAPNDPSGGSSLRHAVDWYIPYYHNPSSWPYNGGSRGSPEFATMMEMAYSYWGDDAYGDIARAHRPVGGGDNGRFFAHSPTLTYGNIFDLNVDYSGEPNQPPSGDFTVSTSGLTASFQANASDPDGAISGYEWNINGSLFTGETVTYTFSEPGTYTVELTIIDDDGATATASSDVSVTEPTQTQALSSAEVAILAAAGLTAGAWVSRNYDQ